MGKLLAFESLSAVSEIDIEFERITMVRTWIF